MVVQEGQKEFLVLKDKYCSYCMSGSTLNNLYSLQIAVSLSFFLRLNELMTLSFNIHQSILKEILTMQCV